MTHHISTQDESDGMYVIGSGIKEINHIAPNPQSVKSKTLPRTASMVASRGHKKSLIESDNKSSYKVIPQKDKFNMAFHQESARSDRKYSNLNSNLKYFSNLQAMQRNQESRVAKHNTTSTPTQRNVEYNKIKFKELPKNSIDKKLVSKPKSVYNSNLEFELNHKIKNILK